MNFSRILDWFWLSSRARALRASADRPARAPEVFAHRARMSRGSRDKRSLRPEPYEGNPDAVVCELFRQSIHWALEARRELLSPSGVTNRRLPSDQKNPRLAREIVLGRSRILPNRASRNRPARGKARSVFASAARTAAERQAGSASALDRTLASDRHPFLVVALAVSCSRPAPRLEDWRDLARGRPWKVSSALHANPCARHQSRIATRVRSTFLARRNRSLPISSSTWVSRRRSRRSSWRTEPTAVRTGRSSGRGGERNSWRMAGS